MLPTIVFPSRVLKTFLNGLDLLLTKPQRHHLEEVVEGLLMTDGRKTLAAMTRQLVTKRDIYAVADFFRESPWTADALRTPLREHLMAELSARIAAVPSARRVVVVSLDESTCYKPRSSQHFEPVDWHGDYTEHTAGVGPQGKRYAHGLPVLTCRVHVDGHNYPVDWRLYTRARTIRRARMALSITSDNCRRASSTPNVRRAASAPSTRCAAAIVGDGAGAAGASGVACAEVAGASGAADAVGAA